MGLRTKIGVAITVTAALVAVLIGFVVHHRTAVNQLATAREMITSRLASAVEDHAAGFDRPHTLINPAGIPEPLRHAAEDRKMATYLDRAGPEPVIWAATRLGDDLIVLKRPYNRETRNIQDLDDVLWTAGGLGTAFSGIVGVSLAAFAGRRIDASARTAERIAEGDLTARLRPRGGKDEIARLTVAVNRMADALAARLQAEREVTANIAHELRTPVAGLVAAAALLCRPAARPRWSRSGRGACGPWSRTSWRWPGWTRTPSAPTPRYGRWATWPAGPSPRSPPPPGPAGPRPRSASCATASSRRTRAASSGY
ncbi:hypothetical protein GCM10020221_04580 [Streptomyces thioluteus]|uniref:histidine kinase n=1 Tax=Streptomyces thioluteus TaxID=66431 RepID=A0ABN3WGE0_STRTU